jgi:hypothetical protein
MKIDEVIRSKDAGIFKTLPRKGELTQDYFDRAVKTNYKIKGYPIYEIIPKGRSRAALMLFVATKEEDGLLGQLNLLKHPHNGEDFTFTEVYFDPEIQGTGIAVELYKLAILKYGFTVTSDESQTKGSETLWAKLARDPDIHVYVWDVDNDSFREFDPEDPDDVYYDPDEMNTLKQEVKDIETRLQDQYMDGDIDEDEYGRLLAAYINPIYDDIEALGNTQEMRLVATRNTRT